MNGICLNGNIGYIYTMANHQIEGKRLQISGKGKENLDKLLSGKFYHTHLLFSDYF